MKSSLEQLIKEMLKLENHFNELIKISGLICEQYGKAHEKYKRTTQVIEERLYDVLHETGSIVGFLREDVSLLIKYIIFTRKFYDFTETELSILIDKENLSSKDKNLISKYRNMDKEILLTRVALLKKEWNKQFNNKSYKKVKGQLQYLAL